MYGHSRNRNGFSGNCKTNCPVEHEAKVRGGIKSQRQDRVVVVFSALSSMKFVRFEESLFRSKLIMDGVCAFILFGMYSLGLERSYYRRRYRWTIE